MKSPPQYWWDFDGPGKIVVERSTIGNLSQICGYFAYYEGTEGSAEIAIQQAESFIRDIEAGRITLKLK